MLETLPFEYDEENWPPYRGFVRCLWCDERFDSGEEFLEHNSDGCTAEKEDH